MSRRTIYLSGSVLMLMGISLGVFFWWWQMYQTTTTVTFLNIGQGDAILISQGANQILIDGGRKRQELLAGVGRRIPFWDRTIEAVIATHPDADHIGGFSGLLEAYKVQAFLSTGVQGDTEVAKQLQEVLTMQHIPQHKVFRGSRLRLPYGGELWIDYPLAALPPESNDSNAGSIVGRFIFGETEMLLTGDLAAEEKVLPEVHRADILKVAHHGSKSSTSTAFLDLVQPTVAIISVGKNSYGHPSPEVLERLEARGITIKRTDLVGDVRYRCKVELVHCVLVE